MTFEIFLAAVYIWEGDMKGKPSAVAKLEAHQLTVIQLRFSPDSKKLLSVGRDRIAIIWDLIDGKWTQEKVFGKGEKKFFIHLLKLCFRNERSHEVTLERMLGSE